MTTQQAGFLERLAFGVIEAGALLVLVNQADKIATLMWAAVLPIAGWMYARLRAPRHLFAVVGGACGLAAFPTSHGLFALVFVLPMPLQLLGLLGLVGEALHGLPGNLLATVFHLERQSDTSVDTILVDYAFNGLVWAAVYGWLGSLADRSRTARPAGRGPSSNLHRRL